MQDMDELILGNIKDEFKTARAISNELGLPYTRVSVRLKHFRRRDEVISVQTESLHVRGVKPLKYKRKF